MEHEALTNDDVIARRAPRRLRGLTVRCGGALATLLVWALVLVAVLSATGRFRMVAVRARAADVKLATNAVAVVDTDNNRIRELRQDGKVYAFSGDAGGAQGYAGDGSAHDDASVRFNTPEGLAINTWGTSDGTMTSLF